MKTFIRSKNAHLLFAVAIAVAIMAGCAGSTNKAAAAKGVLPPATVPDSLFIIPPPPAAGSAAFALDEEYSRRTFALQGTPAWAQAILDASLKFPYAADTYSCALGVPVTEKDTPRLYRLLQIVAKYAGDSTASAKMSYKRPRPFMVNKQPMCTPDEKAHLEGNGSYPSGHNAIGTAWAMVLAEVSPDRGDIVLKRAQGYGVSRMVCNVHWYSDTLQGRYMGAYTAATLNASPWFQEEVLAARAELAAVRTRGLKPTRNCAAEAKAMEMQKEIFK